MKRITVSRCRSLRKNQTDAERKLWTALRNRNLNGIKFRRQFCIDKYILDFYSPEYRLGIEADGSQHYEEKGEKRDKVLAEKISRYGVCILRFSNLDILNNIEGVRGAIMNVIEEQLSNPLTQPSPHRGEGIKY